VSLIANLRVLLFAGAGAIAFGVICLCLFFVVGGGSRIAATALVTVVGASLALGITLIFDLRGSKEITTITTEYTFDRAIPQIRQWIYARSLGDRYASEVMANDAALTSDPQILEKNPETRARDMIVFSLMVYLETRQGDWQMEQERYTAMFHL
jgi:hypothetical protein